jgi:hypothetical protein
VDTNPSGKVTYQLHQNHKLIAYYQWNMKTQPTRPGGLLRLHLHLHEHRTDRPPGITKLGVERRVERHAQQQDLCRGSLRRFGYYDPRIANSDEEYFWRDTGTLQLTGAHARSQTDRDRKQATAAVTYFLDTSFGSHTFRFGGEYYKETQWTGREQNVGGEIEHIYANGTSNQVIFGIPTALRIGSLRDNDNGNLLVINKLDQQDLFVNDSWSLGRVTLNLGLRWDRYRGWMPEQRQLAFAIGPVSVPEQTFEERSFFTFNSLGPRAGVTCDITGDGKTVIKASYGLFWHNPGPDISASANPNASNKSVTYTWRVRGFLDLFNIANSNSAESRVTTTGTTFLRPTKILAPRTARLGVRFTF